MAEAKKVTVEIFTREHAPMVYEMFDNAIHQWHSDLECARIALAWQYNVKPDKDGHMMVGKLKKASDLDRQLHHVDYILILNADTWSAFEDAIKMAVLDHELSHAAPVMDDDVQVEDEQGQKQWRIRKHDVEEFDAVVARHGCYMAKLEQFAKDLARAKDMPLIEEMPTAIPMGVVDFDSLSTVRQTIEGVYELLRDYEPVDIECVYRARDGAAEAVRLLADAGVQLPKPEGNGEEAA